MAEWTAGKMALVAVGAVGTGLLVRKLVNTLRGGDEGGGDDGLPMPPPMPPPKSPRTPAVQVPQSPGSETAGQNWWNGGAAEPPPSVAPPTVEAWRAYIRRMLAEFGFDPSAETFVMQYITMESGGRPCSVGFPGELDAQGQPLESGIGQFMSPHDIKLAKTTVAEMRAACSPHVSFPGLTRASPQAAITVARTLAEAQIRPLTEDEKNRQVAALLTFLAEIRGIVDASFAEQGVTWPKTSADYWAMIKGYHAGQSFPTKGLALAKKALGHAPRNWGEFASGYLSTVSDANTRARHAHALDNARRAGGGSGLPWLP